MIKNIYNKSIKIAGHKNSKNFLDHETIIETWALKKNFLKDGSLNDRYFNINSRKNKKILKNRYTKTRNN